MHENGKDSQELDKSVEILPLTTEGYDDEPCPECGSQNATVEDLYDDDVMFERYTCLECGHRWHDNDW